MPRSAPVPLGRALHVQFTSVSPFSDRKGKLSMNLVFSLRGLAAALVLATIAACGGGGGGSGAPSTAPSTPGAQNPPSSTPQTPAAPVLSCAP
jgi:hypothetical protein